MRRRALLIVVGLAVLAAGALALVVLLRPVSPINRENAARVQPGITRADHQRRARLRLSGPAATGVTRARTPGGTRFGASWARRNPGAVTQAPAAATKRWRVSFGVRMIGPSPH